MRRRSFCGLFGIEHPIALGGMTRPAAGEIIARLVKKAEDILRRFGAAAGLRAGDDRSSSCP